MSENKSWLWRKRPLDKAADLKEDPSSKPHEQEIQMLLAEKAELETDLQDLSEKLAFTLTQRNASDDLAKKNAKTAQEALAGWEKAEATALSLKQELNEALEQRLIVEERTRQLESALKECMQQLRFVREEQEQRIHSLLEKTSKDFEQKRSILESELLKSNRKVAELDAELNELSGALFHKDRHIEDLTQLRAKAEADIQALTKRAESAEKVNTSLKYELRVIEKELEIRNEEREFSLRAADAAHKQHLENSKKIAKLESECQRLRVLVRKRLPGPAALAKMKNEVDVLEKGSRRRLISSSGGSNSRLDYSLDLGSSPESPGRKITVLVEKLCALEEENTGLKEALLKTNNDLQVSKSMYARMATKLTQVEDQLDDSNKAQMIMKLYSKTNGGSTPLHDFSTISDAGNDDKRSCAESWASALITELEQFKNDKEKEGAPLLCKSSSNCTSEINLLDDFVEMEKLALVCVDKQVENASVTEAGSKLAVEGTLGDATLDRTAMEAMGKEIIPVSETVNAESKLERSISKLIEIIEGNILRYQDCERDSSAGYIVRVFQWKKSELVSVLQEFLHCCYNSLNGKADFEIFVEKSTSTMDWIINHCFSLQDVTNMKDAIKKKFDLDETRSESEMELSIDKLVGNIEPPPCFTSSSPNDSQGELPCGEIPQDKRTEIVKVRDEMRQLELSRRQLEEKLGSIIDDGKPLPTPQVGSQNERKKSESQYLDKQILAARAELEEAHGKLSSLETETENKAKRCEALEARCLELQLQIESVMAKDAGEEHINQEVEKQVQTDWEIKTASETLAQCQENILNLGKQLKALASPHEASLFEKTIASPMTTSTATTTTATRKSTTPDTETAIIIQPKNKTLSQRPSLLDRMLAEDNDEHAEQLLGSPKTKEIVIYDPNPKKDPTSLQDGRSGLGLDRQEQVGSVSDSIKQNGVDGPGIGPLAIVPVSKSKSKSSGGFFKKLLWRKKVKGSSKKVAFPFTT